MIWRRTLLVFLLSTAAARAEDWPQWLGPKRDGTTSETVPAWKEAPKVVWRKPVGAGHSTPAVANGCLYVHARVKDKDEEEVIAFDAKTGEVKWRESYARPPYVSVLNTGPQASPTVAGKRVYTYGINGLLSCFDAENGRRIWQINTYKHYKADLPRFGVCCSPLVVGNRVFVSVGGKGSAIAAFDVEKGEPQWQMLDEPASTTSPVVFPSAKGGLPDVVFMTTLRLVGLNPLDGTLNWEFPLVFQPAGTSPTPLVASNLLFTSTMTNGTTAVKLEAKDDKITPERAWQEKNLSGYFSTGASSGSELYLITNTLKPVPSAALRCIELKSGKELWTQEKVGYFHAGVIRTGDGKLLILDDGGNLKLVEANPKEYKELCKSKVCGGTLINPVLANGRVYVRDDKEVICLQPGE
jgi:outer membrane protein assembly factor BamB